MDVIHGWPDDACATILDGRAARPGATVLVMKNVILKIRPDPRGRTF